MFKNLTKGEIWGVIGSAILTAFASAMLNVATMNANKAEIQDAVKKELAEAINEDDPQ